MFSFFLTIRELNTAPNFFSENRLVYFSGGSHSGGSAGSEDDDAEDDPKDKVEWVKNARIMTSTEIFDEIIDRQRELATATDPNRIAQLQGRLNYLLSFYNADFMKDENTRTERILDSFSFDTEKEQLAFAKKWNDLYREKKFYDGFRSSLAAFGRYAGLPETMKTRKEFRDEIENLKKLRDETEDPKLKKEANDFILKMEKIRNQDMNNYLKMLFKEVNREKDNISERLYNESYDMLKKRFVALKKKAPDHIAKIESNERRLDAIRAISKLKGKEKEDKIKYYELDPKSYDDIAEFEGASRAIQSLEGDVGKASRADDIKSGKAGPKNPSDESSKKAYEAEEKRLKEYHLNLGDETLPSIESLRAKLKALNTQQKKDQFEEEYEVAKEKLTKVRELLAEAKEKVKSTHIFKEEKPAHHGHGNGHGKHGDEHGGHEEHDKEKEKYVGKKHKPLTKEEEQKRNHLYGLIEAEKQLKSFDDLKGNIYGDGKGMDEVKRLLDTAEKETDPLKKEDKIRTAEKYLGTIKDYLDNPQAIANAASASLEKTQGYFNEISEPKLEGKKTEIMWLSLFELKKLFYDMPLEWSKRRTTEVRANKQIGKVGSLFYDIPIYNLQSLASDCNRLFESKEMEEVELYEHAYMNKDPWMLLELLKDPHSVDQFKAICSCLAKKGYLRVDNPDYWHGLMQYQDAVWFDCKHPDNELRDLEKLQLKLQRAVGNIWDFQIYFTWKQSNDSAYKDQKNSFEAEAHNLSEKEGGGLEKSLCEMLKEYRKAHASGDEMGGRISMHRYEEFVEYCVKRGKMSPEGKLYYIIQGIATGLLPYDRLAYMDAEFLNDYPCLELLASKTVRGERPTLQDVKDWAKLDAGPCRPGAQFDSWYWSYVMNLPKVQQRLNKALSAKKPIDHDDGTAFIAQTTLPALKIVLDLSHGSHAMPMTLFQNATVSYLQWIDNAAVNHQWFNAEGGIEEELARGLASFMFFNAITAGRICKNQKYFRFDETSKNRAPRSAPFYARSDDDRVQKNGTMGYITKSKQLVASIDRDLEFNLFERLFNVRELSDKKEEKNKVKELCDLLNSHYGDKVYGTDKDMPETAEELFETTPSIFKEVFKKHPEAINNFFYFVRKDMGSNRVEKVRVKKQYQNMYKQNPQWGKGKYIENFNIGGSAVPKLINRPDAIDPNATYLEPLHNFTKKYQDDDDGK